MADENESTNPTTNLTSEEDVPEELKGKVLVAKVGQEQEFLEAMEKAHRTAHGSLGWQGMAEMMFEIGGIDIISAGEIKAQPDWTREEHIAAIKDLLQQIHLQAIMDHAEWVTEEEAEKRRKAKEVLFGTKPTDKA